MESTEAGKLNVCLTDDPRQRLTDLTRNGMAPVKKVRHARILLLVDVNHLDGWRADEYIAAALGIHVNTVKRTRWKFVPEGEAQSLERKRRQTPPVAPKDRRPRSKPTSWRSAAHRPRKAVPDGP